MIAAILGGIALFAASYLAVELVRRHAVRRGILDVPVERSSHHAPTPRGGGAVIAVATLLTPLLVSVITRTSLSSGMMAWMVGGAAIALTGWLDDLRGLSSGSRLAVHAGAAALILLIVGPYQSLDFPLVGRVSLGWAGVPLSLLWVVGMTNAYNFMDGIDGLAAGQGVIAGIAWGAIGHLFDAPQVASVGWAAALTSAAFLLHNWSPARIFMGDVGSGFLGYTFAALPLIMADFDGEADARARLPVVAVAVVWPFVFDALATFVQGALRGLNVLKAHRRHLYQRLTATGVRHSAAASLYLGLAAAGVVLALAWLQSWPGAGVGLLCLGFGSFATLTWAVGVRQRRP